MNYTVILSDAESKALSYVTHSQQEWIDNAVHERCRLAMEEIIQLAVAKCIENNIQVPATRDAIVELAFEQGWVKPASEMPAPALPSTP
jgi:hypothetical protein